MGRVFEQAEQYLDQLGPGRFVEIGASREGDGHLRVGGDGGSTAVLARWAKQYTQSGWLTTVDIDPTQCELVRSLNLEKVEVINKSGEDYLSNDFPYHTEYISLLHLDNFDWDWHPENTESYVVEQQKRYQGLGLTMTNVNSQRAHLAQAVQAVRGLAPVSLVICDDTWYNPWWGHYSGKSGAVVPFLMNHGFEVLYTHEQPIYGTILGRGIQVR